MDEIRTAIRARLEQARELAGDERAPHLTEADTKAHFIDPIVRSLGWSSLGVVRREYYIKSANQFIDYVMFNGARKVLALEAKAFHMPLSDKFASQLISYCAVEGIEWAVLTNGRELQLFNSFLEGNLEEKRLLRLDLLSFANEQEFDSLFRQLWLVSQDSLTTEQGARAWLNQRRLDVVMREMLHDPDAWISERLREQLAQRGINATKQDVARWFRDHLSTPLADTPIPIAPSKPAGRLSEISASAVQASGRNQESSASTPPAITNDPVAPGVIQPPRNAHYRVSLMDLLRVGLLQTGTTLVLAPKGNRDWARATVSAAGEIVYQGKAYRAPSDADFARIVGWPRINGWDHWYAELPGGRRSLASLRTEYLQSL